MSKEARQKAKIKYENKCRSDLKTYLQYLCSHAKQRSKENNIEFNLSSEFLEKMWTDQKGLCAITKIPMEHGRKRRSDRYGPGGSIDRIIPSLGYVCTNVRFICDSINIMKSNKTDDELKYWCQKVLKGLEDDN